jgi:hypothetical protein
MAFIEKLLGGNKHSTISHFICQFLIRANKETGTGSLFLIQIRIRKRELVPFSLFRFEKGTEVFISDFIHTFSIIVEVISPLFITAVFDLETVWRKQTLNHISFYLPVPYSRE